MLESVWGTKRKLFGKIIKNHLSRQFFLDIFQGSVEVLVLEDKFFACLQILRLKKHSKLALYFFEYSFNPCLELQDLFLCFGLFYFFLELEHVGHELCILNVVLVFNVYSFEFHLNQWRDTIYTALFKSSRRVLFALLMQAEYLTIFSISSFF